MKTVTAEKKETNVREQIEILIRLQKIDTEAHGIKAGLNAVADKLAELDEELGAFEKTITADESAVDEFKKEYRELESDLQAGVSRAEKAQEKLRSVKTNKEYQSMLKEIEEGKAKRSQIEDRMLDCLDRLEEVEQSIQDKKKAFQELSGSIRDEKEKIDSEAAEDRKKLTVLDADREDVSGMVDPKLMEIYNMLKLQYQGGTVVAPVRKAICYGCNVGLPPQLYNELHRFDDVKICPHCQRIIYFEKSE